MPNVRVGNQDVFNSDSIPEETQDEIFRQILEEQRLQREGDVAPNTATNPQSSETHIGSLPEQINQPQPSNPGDGGYTNYIIHGRSYMLPNDMTEAERGAYLQHKLNNFDPTPSSPNPESITTDSFRHDPDWIHASKVTYAKREGKPFTGTDAEAADYGVNQMGWFNYNLPMVAVDANRMRTADVEEKRAFLRLMQNYNRLDMLGGGANLYQKFEPISRT